MISLMNDEICVSCGASIPVEGSSMICSKCMDFEPSFDTVKVTVMLDKLTDIRDLVNMASMCQDDVVIKSGHYAVNAKSIMALFSLDLTKPVEVVFYGNIPYEVREGMKKLIVN